MNILAGLLPSYFEPVQPWDFYRDIFPEGELDCADGFTPGKYTGIAVEITKEKKSNGKPLIKRFSVTDELDEIDYLIHTKNFCVMAPISYIGKERKSENARIMYALCVEVDGLKVKDGKQVGLDALINQWSERVHWIPQPTYIVASGNGLHLYYVFENGVPLFKNMVKEIQKYKRRLTEMIWNRHVTELTGDKVQQESIFQAFRVPGTVTKAGDDIAQAFKTGEKVTIDYMNSFVTDKFKMSEVYKSELTLAQAKEKYPEWYEKRIVKKEPKGHWICGRAVYDWWKREIEYGAVVGHRYYCLMLLSIYAIKCNISREELERDCMEFMEMFEERTTKEDNHFTIKDVLDALQCYEDSSLITYPVNSIANRSGIPIEKNKRYKGNQKLSRSDNMKMRAIRERDIIYPDGEWRNKNGRPTAEDIVREWQFENPNGKKADCIRDTGLSKPTVYKWFR